jgi:hypothetical protein
MEPGGDIPRRAFLKSAVAIGGAAAFSACLGREDVSVPTGSTEWGAYPRRQHAWNEVLPRDDAGNVLAPRHRVLLYMNYDSVGPPTSQDRKLVEQALRGVEAAYERSGTGLLLTLSYSPSYFDRFESSSPNGVTLPDPEALAPFEDPAFDTPDAVLHLASNTAQVVLGAEEALRGEVESLNGVEQPDTALTDVLSIAERRPGFVGSGLPAEHAEDIEDLPADAVPDDAPMLMGFKSDFSETQPSEDRVTIDAGPFAGGTTQHVSKLRLDLDQWYTQDDRWQREAKMFCPFHAENDVIEGTGENLGTQSGMGECADAERAARSEGVVGHSQKSARARDEDDVPLILRRDFNATADGTGTLHFLSLQRRIEDFVETREAMNGTDLSADTPIGQRANNGLLQYIRTERRGNYLLPPRALRALPPATPTDGGGG